MTDAPELYLFALIFTFLPFIFSILFFLYLFIRHKEVRKENYFESYIFCISISIFLLQSSIFNSLLEVLKCKEIDGKYYIERYLLENCNSERYMNWRNYLIIPSFCFYAGIVPASMIYFMGKNKKNLHKNKLLIGLSLNGLGKTKFYWY